MSMITQAISDGYIFRYISKPWDDEELQLALDEALQVQNVLRDRDNPKALTSE